MVDLSHDDLSSNRSEHYELQSLHEEEDLHIRDNEYVNNTFDYLEPDHNNLNVSI